ncbi:uncharacterized protein LOC103316118 [Nasonia vitripennis]|uniref:Uncharacterized protein n=1 Tax=Nasonia vitripennis TaxID=7425 RepID=A0A7M7H4U0_NASVI|nr:uncharacterized protein LOC103316118 [Nasonia vitripennis]XP_008206254.1 uncharacterized protein LOC103316118 [Nasonia vitripennis]
MFINNTEDSLDHNVSKPSLPKKLIIEKYKRLAEKAQKKQDCVDVSNEIESIEDCVKEQNEKSDDSRDITIEKSPLKEIKRIKVSVPVSLSESERRIQLTKKMIMQEKLFKRSCSSSGDEKFKMSPVIEPEVKKSFKNYPRQQNNRSRMQNSKWNQQSTNQKGNKSNSFAKPIRSSENSFKLEGSKVLQNYSTQQDTNDKKSNKLVVSSSSLDNNLNPSSSTSSTASNVALSPSKLTSSESINDIECKSVLHLKKPLVNKKNEAIYHENHGKMEPMSWLVINSKKNALNFQKGRLPKESIEKVAARKDEGNKEFLNFVDSSTSSNTVFRVHSNVTEIRKIAFPLAKIKTSIDQKIDANLRVTAQIKEKFTLSRVKSTANQLIDLIECKMEQSLLMSQLINEKTVDNKENSSASISSQLQEKTVEKSKDLHFKKEPKDISRAPLEENLVNTAKKQTDIEDDDDRFNFEKPTRNVTPSIKEDGSSKMSNSAKKLSIETQAYLTKLKQFHKTQLDSSLDSDDLSLVCTSEIDDLSALRGSTYSKFEAVTKKIKNSSTEDSYKYSQSAVAEQKENEKLQLKASQNFEDFDKEDNKKRIKVEEKNLDTIPNEIKNQLMKKGDSKPNLEFDLDSGLGLKTSNSTKSDSFIISRDKSESDSGASCTIFHKHSDVSSSVVIQEIDSTSEAKSVKSEMQSENLYEDIDSNEEFDIVNVEEFGPCAALLDKLKAVAAAQKAVATGIINEEDAKAIMGFEENYEIAADEIEKGGVKAIMGLEENNDETNTQSTSMKTGEDEPAITKDNISEKVETDKSRDSGYPLSDCDNKPKICNPTTTKDGVSKRVQKMKNALQKYQKKYKTEDSGEGILAEKVQQEQQRPIDAQKNQSLRTGLILPRRQILNEILKQKLHLQCKPILIQDLKQR